MKKLFLTFTLFLVISRVFAQLVWVEVHGDTQFCPGDNRESTYSINDNFTGITYWKIDCKRCVMRVSSSDPWVSFLEGGSRPAFGTFFVKWDEGNFDDAWIRYYASGNYGWFSANRTDTEYVKLVENVPISSSYPPNVIPAVSSSVSSIPCGSTQSFTYTANWKNATSYSWSVSNNATISGSSTGSTITVLPNSGASGFIRATVIVYNSACGVYSPENYKDVNINAPSVSAISGPDYVCYGAPSVVSHYVNNIPGVTYEWFGDGLTFPNGNTSRQVTVQGTSTGNKTLKVTVRGCGTSPVEKEKAVFVASGTPMHPVIYQSPYQHCAGSCQNYSLMVPTGYASEMQYRYNYGSWYTANSSGMANICTSSYDYGYKPVELRSIGICGNYSSTYTQSIQISSCGYYMTTTSPEDSLAISELGIENDVALYPNPATTTMTIRLPEDTGDTQITIISDKNEVITSFENNNKLFTLNTSRLAPGYYYLNVVAKNKKTTKRFLVE